MLSCNLDIIYNNVVFVVSVLECSGSRSSLRVPPRSRSSPLLARVGIVSHRLRSELESEDKHASCDVCIYCIPPIISKAVVRGAGNVFI